MSWFEKLHVFILLGALSGCVPIIDLLKMPNAETDEVSKQQSLKIASVSEAVGNYAAAIDVYLNLLSKDPANEELLFMLGNSYSKAGAKRNAADVFEQLEKLDPANKETQLALGSINLSLYRPEIAKVYFENALRLAPFDFMAFQDLALLKIWRATMKPRDRFMVKH
ncbi:MAG: tetratricopeptide repeat protein [Sneathiella sp.]